MIEQNQLTLTGVIPPMITPLTREGEVDQIATERLVAHLIEGGVDGIFVLGSSGEGPWLTAHQCKQVIESTVGSVSGRVPILAGVIEPSTGRTLEAVEVAEAAGVDAIVVTSPYYFEADGQVQYQHFKAVAAATSLPIVLYNIPSKTHNPMAPDTVQMLLELGSVVGIKDSSEDWEHFEKLLDLRKVKPGFQVLQGSEGFMAQAMLAGADGVVPGLSNLAPELYGQLVTASQAGDEATALSLQEQINALRQLLTHGFWLACLKYAASLLGFGSGATCELNADALPASARTGIRRTMQDHVPQFAL